MKKLLAILLVAAFVFSAAISVLATGETNTKQSFAQDGAQKIDMAATRSNGIVPNGFDRPNANMKQPSAPVKAIVGEIRDTAKLYCGTSTDMLYNMDEQKKASRSFKFASSDSDVATVDENGCVTGIKPGTATISISTVDGDFFESCNVTVEDELDQKTLYGYVSYSPSEAYNYYASFSNTDPSTFSEFSSFNYPTYAATIAGDTLYGYCLSNGVSTYGLYYTIDMETGDVVFPGLDSDIFVVTGMSYDHTTQTMYALCSKTGNDYYVCKVDRATGKIAESVAIESNGDWMWTFAIDANGNAYVVTGAYSYEAEIGQLQSLDLNTGELTHIASTGIDTFYVQSMSFDLDTGLLYWAQASTDGVHLRLLDTQDASTIDLGPIGVAGDVSLMCLSIPNSLEVSDPYAENTEINFIDSTDNSIIKTMKVASGYMLNESDYPLPPSHEGLVFSGWDYRDYYDYIYFNTDIYAHYNDANHPKWSFETLYEVNQWSVYDADGDGENWGWSQYHVGGFLYTYDGDRCIYSQSFSNDSGALDPDNYIISPQVILPSNGEELELSFWYMGQFPMLPTENFGVYVSTDGGVTWDEELAFFTSTAEWQQGIVDLSAYAGQTINFAFRHYKGMENYMLNIDLVEISSGTLIIPDPTPTPPPTPTPTPTPTPGLGGDDILDAWYFETEDEVNEWTLKDKDGDGLCWNWSGTVTVDWYAHDGQECMFSLSYSNDGGALRPDNWLISPSVYIPYGLRGSAVTFWYAAQDEEYPLEYFGVYVSTDGGETWSDELGYYRTAYSYQRGLVDLTPYIGDTIQIAFRHYNSGDMYAVNLDTIEIWTSGTAQPTPTYSAAPETPTPTPAPDYELGDVNFDGDVNTGDAAAILRYCAGLDDLSELALSLGDINNDGDVNTGDAAHILRKIAFGE